MQDQFAISAFPRKHPREANCQRPYAQNWLICVGSVKQAEPTPGRADSAIRNSWVRTPITLSDCGWSAASVRDPLLGAGVWGKLGACFPDAEMGVLRTQPAVGSRAVSGRVHVVRPNRIRWGSPPQPPGCQRCLCPASTLSPASRMMAALGTEPQLRVRRKSSGRTRRRSSTSCCRSHGRSSTRAQKRVW
jgi:hypothetical protein